MIFSNVLLGLNLALLISNRFKIERACKFYYKEDAVNIALLAIRERLKKKRGMTNKEIDSILRYAKNRVYSYEKIESL